MSIFNIVAKTIIVIIIIVTVKVDDDHEELDDDEERRSQRSIFNIVSHIPSWSKSSSKSS